ncbi:MAG TPA: N-acetyltransferase [Xanthobacteraceae bacterium]|nr:N-acetyltransferase [Xanthobacteraceae bacterium]
MSETTIRPELPGDVASVRDVLRAAFQGEAEAKLVDGLRAGDDIALSLVATDAKERVVGYVAFPRLLVDEIPCIGLAPLAVALEYQRRGVGEALITRGMLALKQRGEKLAFVLGDPAYYRRFGFDPQAAAAFISDYAGPCFMAYRFTADAPASGTVHYPPAFARLG